ncbi:MAG: hypothetical protein QXQ54_08115 [Thermoplasmata archaeon]
MRKNKTKINHHRTCKICGIRICGHERNLCSVCQEHEELKKMIWDANVL